MMNREELYEDLDYDYSLSEKYFGISTLKSMLLLLFVLLLGVYLGNILFGDNSLDILFGLQEYENYLRDDIFRLKEENAELLHTKFELIELHVK